ncbi:hypothetical protein JWH04_16160 [Xanthomonas melonis]|uniref:hypothetical protein n=1 Tax=Xanthomonas melonis TaxID=56456 RepID=UPI001E3395DB|nr:hypothetical protein [Xanthomonas melonis]MCD0280444.1 hypothetical protein [Xanthomonas melonis]
MNRKHEFQSSIGDFIAGQLVNTDSQQAAQLAHAIREAITTYKADGGENAGAFSADASYEDGEFTATVSFHEDSRLTIMYVEGTDPVTVGALYQQLPEVESELCRIAGLMLSEGWVAGYSE